MIDHYPIIKIPKFLTKPNLYLDDSDDLSKPTKPNPPKLKSNSSWLIPIYIFLGMPLISVTLGIPGFIIAIILLIVVISYTSNEEKRHNDQIQKYESAIIEYNQKFEIQCKRYKETTTLNANPKLKAQKIWNTRVEFFKTAEPPSDSGLDAKKGVSENNFLSMLRSTFKDMILIDKTIINYTPDFIYYNPKLNLYIDIEIDEPYDGLTKEPVHYSGADDFRDSCFLIRRWCVLRFSEKQIVEQPTACCDEIKRTINTIFPSTYKQEEIENSLSVDKCWTKSKAKEMAINNYRDTYLSNRYTKKEEKKQDEKYKKIVYRIKLISRVPNAEEIIRMLRVQWGPDAFKDIENSIEDPIEIIIKYTPLPGTIFQSENKIIAEIMEMDLVNAGAIVKIEKDFIEESVEERFNRKPNKTQEDYDFFIELSINYFGATNKQINKFLGKAMSDQEIDEACKRAEDLFKKGKKYQL